MQLNKQVLKLYEQVLYCEVQSTHWIKLSCKLQCWGLRTSRSKLVAFYYVSIIRTQKNFKLQMVHLNVLVTTYWAPPAPLWYDGCTMVRGAVDGVLLAVAEGPMLTRGVTLTALAAPGDAATTVTLGVTELCKYPAIHSIAYKNCNRRQLQN